MRRFYNSQKSTAWKIILEWMTGNVVIFEPEALKYIVLGEEEHVPYMEIVCTTECLKL